MERRVVVSGAPGTGKTTVARAIADDLALPLLSLDDVKEALADSLGVGDEDWSNAVGDAAADIVFRLATSFPSVVAEGWWRRERRDRAVQEFAGWIEVFCRCEPHVAEERMRARRSADRHPIHRDVINPDILEDYAAFVPTVTPLSVGPTVVAVDTTDGFDRSAVAAAVRSALEP